MAVASALGLASLLAIYAIVRDNYEIP